MVTTPARTTAPNATDRAPDERMVRHAVALLAPTWNTWHLQTLAQHADGMRLADLEKTLPFVPTGSRHNSLTRLTRAGLVDRPSSPHRAGARLYRITDAGRSALPVHQRVADWARTHICPGETVPLAEAAEIGFTQIMGTHTLDTLSAVRAAGQATSADMAAIYPHGNRADWTNYLIDAHQLGLLDRVSHGRYILSAAANDLGPVLDGLAAFAQRRAPRSAPTVSASVARTAAQQRAQAGSSAATSPPSRTAATAVPTRPPRSTPAAATAKARPVPAVAFSHPDKPVSIGTAGAGRSR